MVERCHRREGNAGHKCIHDGRARLGRGRRRRREWDLMCNCGLCVNGRQASRRGILANVRAAAAAAAAARSPLFLCGPFSFKAPRPRPTADRRFGRVLRERRVVHCRVFTTPASRVRRGYVDEQREEQPKRRRGDHSLFRGETKLWRDAVTQNVCFSGASEQPGEHYGQFPKRSV